MLLMGIVFIFVALGVVILNIYPLIHEGFVIIVPEVSKSTEPYDSQWRIVVNGLIRHVMNLSLEGIAAMPRNSVSSELYCLPFPGSSGVLVDSGNWTGVRLGYILEKAEISPEAVKIAFYAEDSFTTDLTITTAMREDIILAFEKDGKPLPEKLRLVAPEMWGYKWIKWLIQIEVMDYDFRGRYESRGFPDDIEILEQD